MAKDKTTLRFWLRTDRPNKDGSAPIHLVYQIQGDKKSCAVPGVKVFPVNWDSKKQEVFYRDRKAAKQIDPEFDPKLLPTTSKVNDINLDLLAVRNDIRKIEDRFRDDGTQFSIDMVIATLKDQREPETKKEEPGKNVVEFIAQFSKETTAHKIGTIKAYTGLNNHLIRYEAQKKVRLTFENMDVPTMKSIQNFMLEKYQVITRGGSKRSVQINNITVAKLLSTLKTMIKKAEDEYDITVNPKYKKFKNPHPRKDGDIEVIALTQEELDAIYNLKLPNKAQDEARDIFCFSCATGLRFKDLADFRRHHITRDNRIVMSSSDKNSKGIDVPIIPMSYEIIKKYEAEKYPLPVTKRLKFISNQKLNDHIKKIAELAGIDTEIEIAREIGTRKVKETFKKSELISIHTGRKTFVTLSLEKGIPLQDVMSMTTHSSFKAVKRYMNVTKERKKAVMVTAYGPLPVLKVAK